MLDVDTQRIRLLQNAAEFGARLIDCAPLLGEQAVDIALEIDRDRIGQQSHQPARGDERRIENDAGRASAGDFAQELLQGDARIHDGPLGNDDELAAAQGGQHRLRRPHRHHPGDFAVLIRGAEFAAGEEIVVIER